MHDLRVVFRRLRSTLTTFEKCFDTAVTEHVKEEVAWINRLLGRARDIEVVREHVEEVIAELRPELVRGRTGAWIAGQLSAAHRHAHHAAVEAMASDRYFALVDTVDSWRDSPPWSDERDRPATSRLPKALKRATAKIGRAAAAVDTPVAGEPGAGIHDVRKAAKRVRYAAETLAPALGSNARKTARTAKKIQTVLGKYGDAAMAAEHVLRLTEAADVDGKDTFTLGVMHARLEQQAAEQARMFERVQKKGRQLL